MSKKKNGETPPPKTLALWVIYFGLKIVSTILHLQLFIYLVTYVEVRTAGVVISLIMLYK